MTDISAYTAWVDSVHRLGGVATVWPFATGNYAASYGQPAARFPVDVYTSYINDGTFSMAWDGVQTNNPGSWVYVLAAAMEGNQSVNEAAQGLIDPTQAELEQACAVNGNCPVDWSSLVKEIVIGVAVLVGVSVLGKLG